MIYKRIYLPCLAYSSRIIGVQRPGTAAVAGVLSGSHFVGCGIKVEEATFIPWVKMPASTLQVPSGIVSK